MTNKYEIASAATIAGIEHAPVKLSATDQRAVFGAYVFGKHTIKVDTDNQGSVTVSRKVIPNDLIFATFSLDEVAAAVNAGRKLRAG